MNNLLAFSLAVLGGIGIVHFTSRNNREDAIRDINKNVMAAVKQYDSETTVLSLKEYVVQHTTWFRKIQMCKITNRGHLEQFNTALDEAINKACL